jgi:hypothetical protein
MTERTELRFAEGEYSELGYVSDLRVLIRAINTTMPRDAIIYIEGDSIVPEVASFLSSHLASEPRDIWPGSSSRKSSAFHVPLAGTNLAELGVLADSYAAPEVCDHLVVYQDDELLLTAYDAGGNFVEVSKSLPDETIQRLRAALGEALMERKPKLLDRFFRGERKTGVNSEP